MLVERLLQSTSLISPIISPYSFLPVPLQITWILQFFSPWCFSPLFSETASVSQNVVNSGNNSRYEYKTVWILSTLDNQFNLRNLWQVVMQSGALATIVWGKNKQMVHLVKAPRVAVVSLTLETSQPRWCKLPLLQITLNILLYGNVYRQL